MKKSDANATYCRKTEVENIFMSVFLLLNDQRAAGAVPAGYREGAAMTH